MIATGRGGSAEYLRDGENCLLVPAYDPPALAGAVLRLGGDAELRDLVADGGSVTASRYTEAAFNTAVEHHLREVAGRPRPAGSAPPAVQSAAA